MGWVWRDDDAGGNDVTDHQPLGDSAGEANCSTSTVVRSKCKTEEVEPGKFVRKCDKTEEILRHCFGKPSEVVQSTTEHTEEDVTDQMARGSTLPNHFEENPLNFPGLRSDLDDIERHFFTGIKGFFEAAEDMRSSFFDIMGDRDHHSTTKRGVPIEDHPKIEEHHRGNDENVTSQPFSSGDIDLSGLAKDV
ncbi:Mal d 1-associated protein [Hirschfeldia incana]|nr:Mal d 1-associated protein [Hirschfeldia incana]